jgi:integrase
MSVAKNARTGAWEVRWRQSGGQRSRSFRSERLARRFDAELVEQAEAGLLDELTIAKDRTSGEWEVRWADQRHDVHQRMFGTKQEAVVFESRIIGLRRLGRPTDRIDTGTRTVADYATTVWVPQHVEGLAVNTRRAYADLWRVHLNDTFGAMALRDVTAARIRQWQSDRLASGAGRTALNHALVVFGTILQRALEDEEIQSNPVRIVKKVPTGAKTEVEPLAPLTVEQVRSRALDEFDATLIAVLAYAGLRPSEAWALRWGDIRDRTIHVQQATDSIGDVKSTKTRSSRTVKLLAPLAQDLAAFRLAQGRPAAKALIFPSPYTGGVATRDDQGSWRRRRWGDAWSAAVDDGVVTGERPRVYDLRHSFASLLLAEGRSIHYVAKQLGHSPALTLATYGHVIDEFEDQAKIDPDVEIRKARDAVRATSARPDTAAEVSA